MPASRNAMCDIRAAIIAATTDTSVYRLSFVIRQPNILRLQPCHRASSSPLVRFLGPAKVLVAIWNHLLVVIGLIISRLMPQDRSG